MRRVGAGEREAGVGLRLLWKYLQSAREETGGLVETLVGLRRLMEELWWTAAWMAARL